MPTTIRKTIAERHELLKLTTSDARSAVWHRPVSRAALKNLLRDGRVTVDANGEVSGGNE